MLVSKLSLKAKQLFEAGFKPMEVVDPSCAIGIEVEVERQAGLNKQEPVFWTEVEDGSLRNGGREFIFCTPHKGEYISAALHELKNFVLNEKAEFTDRTSIHVHANVRKMTFDQLRVFVLVYLALERVLFNWIGQDRDKNLYCVPLLDTRTFRQLRFLSSNINQWKWPKYCALNLAPISTYGSVEFRHMYGNMNIPILMQWVNMLQAMRTYAYRTSIDKALHDIGDLNTNSLYQQFINQLFWDVPNKIKEITTTQAQMEEGVIAVKEYLATDDLLNTLTLNFVKNSELGQVLSKLEKSPKKEEGYGEEKFLFETGVPVAEGPSRRVRNLYGFKPVKQKDFQFHPLFNPASEDVFIEGRNYHFGVPVFEEMLLDKINYPMFVSSEQYGYFCEVPHYDVPQWKELPYPIQVQPQTMPIENIPQVTAGGVDAFIYNPWDANMIHNSPPKVEVEVKPKKVKVKKDDSFLSSLFKLTP